jgi:hypothetical protein
LEWGGDGKGEVSLRATWSQGGQDLITPKEGFQVSKRELKGKLNKKLARGIKKGDCAITVLLIWVIIV